MQVKFPFKPIVAVLAQRNPGAVHKSGFNLRVHNLHPIIQSEVIENEFLFTDTGLRTNQSTRKC